MNIKQLLLIALAIASFGIGGCGKDESSTEQPGTAVQHSAGESGKPPGQVGEPQTAETTQSSQPPSSEAPHTTGPAGEQPTTKAQQGLAGEVQELQEKANELQQKASQGAQQSKALLAEQLNALKQQREDLEQKANEAAAEVAASGMKHVNDLLGKLNQSLDVLTRSVERETPEGTSAPGGTAPSSGSR